MSDFPFGLNPDDSGREQEQLAKLLEELNLRLKGFGSRQGEIYKKLSNLDEGYLNHIVKSLEQSAKREEKLFSHLMAPDREELKLMKAMMGVMENHVAITNKLLEATKKDENNLRTFLERMDSPAYKAKAQGIMGGYAKDSRDLQDRNMGETLKDIMSDKSTGFDYSNIASMLFGSKQKYQDKDGKMKSTWVRRQGADVKGSHAYQLKDQQDLLKKSYDMEYGNFRDDEYAKSMGINDFDSSRKRKNQEEQQYWQKAYDASRNRKDGEGPIQGVTHSVERGIDKGKGEQGLLVATAEDKIIAGNAYQKAFETTSSVVVTKDRLLGLPKAYAEPALAIINAIERNNGQAVDVEVDGGGNNDGGMDASSMIKNLLPLIAGAIPALLPIILGGGAIALIMKMFSDQGKKQAEDVLKIQEDWTPAMKEAFNKEFQGAIPTRMDAEAFENENKGTPISIQTSARTNEIASNAVFTDRGTQARVNNSVVTAQTSLQSQGIGPNPYGVSGLQWKVENTGTGDTFFVRKGNSDAWIGVTPASSDLQTLAQRASSALNLRKLSPSSFNNPPLLRTGEVDLGRLAEQLRSDPSKLTEALKKSPLTFDQGGIVPGPIGQAVPATVHAGETIVPTHKESVRKNLDTLINDNINNSTISTQKMEDLLQRLLDINSEIKKELERNTTATTESGSKVSTTPSAPARNFPVLAV